MSILERWIGFIFRVATGSAGLRNRLTPIIGLLFFAIIGLFIAVAVILDRVAGFLPFPPEPWHLIAGVPLLVIGLSVMLWCVAVFRRTKGTPVPINPPPRLVCTGLYAYVRNPMLTGIFAWMFGLSLLLRSSASLVIFTPLFILLNVLELRWIEEPELARRLGEDYIHYRKQVPMFLPYRKKFGE